MREGRGGECENFLIYVCSVIYKFIHHCVFPKICSIHYPSWRRYTFLSHLTTKSKISVRWIKKLVAATYGVYIFIHKLSLSHLYNYSAFTILYAFVRIRNGRHCVSCRHISCAYNIQPHQQRCAYTICLQIPPT